MIIGITLSHRLVGLRAWCYEQLVLLQFLAILLGLVWIWAPTTRARRQLLHRHGVGAARRTLSFR